MEKIKNIPKYVDLTVKGLKMLPRVITSGGRVMPDFLILGAQKSGTTSLAKNLAKHPQIKTGKKLEVHHFDGGNNGLFDKYRLGKMWYRAYFPLEREISGNTKVFEKTPEYLSHPLAPKRISQDIPNVNLIVILRNPVDRAISHFQHEKREGREKLPMLMAFKKEEKRTKENFKQQKYLSKNFIRHRYKERGCYEKHLKRYLKFFDRKQMLIIRSEKFFSNPTEVLRKAFHFIGVNEYININSVESHNVANYSETNEKAKKYSKTITKIKIKTLRI